MSTWFFNLYESMDFSANWAFQLKVVLDAVILDRFPQNYLRFWSRV